MSALPNPHRNAFVLLGMFLLLTASAVSAQDLEYNADVRPILADACFSCHGPDSAARKADLRLDQRQAAIDMGAIVPGDADGSEMLRRINSDDPVELMPPPETKKTLTPEQKEILQRWVESGAEYQLHWSFLPIERPVLPDVQNEQWVRNPIDRFVLSKLESLGLEPAPEADRRTLARRVSLDLIGLPPDPAWVDDFVQDTSPNAYENYVDRLLRSTHWGEHRARYWLDAARYADTHGLHFDNYREMWSYRDWVINAFNDNMPFDRFTIVNLAGDLLPNRTLADQIGSGFNRCNMTTNEGGIIDEEYKVLYARDRTETTAQVWLGLTAGCAVCHSHKFDPLSQREFYELSAFFNNTTQPVRDGNVQDTPPVVKVPQSVDRQRWAALPAEIKAAEDAVTQRREIARADFDKWLTTASVESLGQPIAPDSLDFRAALDEGQGNQATVVVHGSPQTVPLRDSIEWVETFQGSPALRTAGEACAAADVGDFESDQPFSCTAWVRMPANDGYGAIVARMSQAQGYRGWDMWTQQRRAGMHVINEWPARALKVVARDQLPANEWVHVTVTYDGSQKASGVKVYYNGKDQPTNVEKDSLEQSIRTDVPLKIGSRDQGDAFSGGLRDIRVYRQALTPGEVASLSQKSRFEQILRRPADQRTQGDTEALFEFWLTTVDTTYQDLVEQVEKLKNERTAIESRGTIAHVMQERAEPATAFVLYRGEYDQRRDEVAPSTPAVLPPFSNDWSRDRLGLAKWLLLPENPLTARVTVNRFWQQVFGTGIVRTAGDFGVSGELPTHPELLDYLAVEFRESGWDIKRFFKTMVMSATYRQSAAATPEKVERDPANRWLARGPRFRMDGEMVRDYALAVSGLLVPKIGGPSVKPYQPPGVWESIAMNVSNTRKYERDTGEGLYRRSLYTFIKRMAPPASMEIFNAPNREVCVVSRERTNTPLQALVTLNDEQFVEAARHLAELTLEQSDDTFQSRIDFMARRLLLRTFRPDELQIVRRSYDALVDYYQDHAAEAAELLSTGESAVDSTIDPGELAAWTMLANELMNLDEVLNK